MNRPFIKAAYNLYLQNGPDQIHQNISKWFSVWIIYRLKNRAEKLKTDDLVFILLVSSNIINTLDTFLSQ